MRNFLTALALSASLFASNACESRDSVKDPATQADRAKLADEITNALPKFKPVLWEVINFKCGGEGAVFVVSWFVDRSGINYDTYHVNILDRRSGRLLSHMQDDIFYKNNSRRKIDKIIRGDRGNDGCEEVDLHLADGERRTYIWSVGDYVRADRYINNHNGEEVFYKDLDGDGEQEAAVLHGPDEDKPFSVYRWGKGGWMRYTPKQFESLEREYNAIDRNLDALALAERREAIRSQLFGYLTR